MHSCSKKLIKKLESRLKHLKKKRCCIIRQQRRDVAQLLENGRYKLVFNRVNQIYNDERMVAVYDLLAGYCELICHQFSYIRRITDCPNEVNEAISSIIFASARCGELPELVLLRKFFKERYGDHFEATALDLLPGNLVNLQIREKLSMEKVPDEVLYKSFEDIKTIALEPKPLTLEFTSYQQEQLQATIGNVDQGFLAPVINDFSPNQIGLNAEPDTQGIYYFEDVEEHQSPLQNGLNGTADQRFFKFISAPDVIDDPHVIEKHIIKSERSRKLMPRKSRKISDSSEIINYYDKASPYHCQKKNIFVPRNQIGDQGMYARAMSFPPMPLAKPVEESSGMQRSFSLPVQPSPPHVHPKLPDYDELVEKFTARKKEYLENQK